ncbi:MAG: hypothetical protein MO852_09720 [Candidatus Devosia euplotis]|nr:hypothetical protein [Candidatus Devosia euplotis]
MVVRSLTALDRSMLADFIDEIARECAAVGMIVENRPDELVSKNLGKSNPE